MRLSWTIKWNLIIYFHGFIFLLELNFHFRNFFFVFKMLTLKKNYWELFSTDIVYNILQWRGDGLAKITFYKIYALNENKITHIYFYCDEKAGQQRFQAFSTPRSVAIINRKSNVSVFYVHMWPWYICIVFVYIVGVFYVHKID